MHSLSATHSARLVDYKINGKLFSGLLANLLNKLFFHTRCEEMPKMQRSGICVISFPAQNLFAPKGRKNQIVAHTQIWLGVLKRFSLQLKWWMRRKFCWVQKNYEWPYYLLPKQIYVCDLLLFIYNIFIIIIVFAKCCILISIFRVTNFSVIIARNKSCSIKLYAKQKFASQNFSHG